MANMDGLKKSSLLDWENELKYQKSVLNNPNAPKEVKEYAKQRIKVAEAWIKKIKDMD